MSVCGKKNLPYIFAESDSFRHFAGAAKNEGAMHQLELNLAKTMETSTASNVKPCYAPFKSVVNTIKRFNELGVPARVDGSVLSNHSGSTASSIKKGFEFLGLVDSRGTSAQRLHDLVAAYGTDAWKPKLAMVIEDSYAPIVSGLDLINGTTQQLADAFSKTLSGSTRLKAIRFYLEAMKAADIKHSTHFKVPKEQRSSGKGSTPKSGQDSKTTSEEKSPPAPDGQTPPPTVGIPEGFTRVDVSVPGRSHPYSLIFPLDTTDAEWDFVQMFFKQWHDLRRGKEEQNDRETPE